MRPSTHEYRCGQTLPRNGHGMRSLILLFLAIASPAFGQIVATSEPVTVIDAGDASRVVGSYLILPKGGTPTSRHAANLRYAGTDGYSVAIEASDIQREPVAVHQIDASEYLVFGVGKVWVRLTAIDFENRKFSVIETLVEVGAVIPDPPPDPPDPPDPPPIPDDVPNAYGVGKVAYELAVRDDGQTLTTYRNIYTRAADFLYGIPSLKFVISSNSADSMNPDRSVLAWMRREFSLIQCTDRAKCEAWKEWNVAVLKAIDAAQTRQQFSRADWYQVFGEVSAALELVE